jgi:uncharacterized RDD family membrane protein YckC
VTVIHDPAARAAQAQPAGFVTRVGADLVDFALVAAFYIVAILLIGVSEVLLSDARWHIPDVASWVHAIGFPAIFAAYLAWSWTFTGASIGKRVFGLRLRSLDGARVGAARAIARAVLCVVIIGPVSLVVCIFSRRRAALHDLVLGTKVVYDWRSRPPA